MVLFCVSLQNALPGKPASGQVISHDLSCGSEPRWDSVNVTGGWYVIGFSLHGRHAHIPNLLTLEHVAKCVLMRNSWSGSAQIKDIPVRELPPVSPSCSAASKWILQPLPPAGAARAQGWHSMCQLPFLDEQTTLSLRSCHYLMPGQTGDYRGQGTFLHYSSGHFSNWEHINTTSLRVFIISKPNMVAFSSSCSLRKECYTYSPLVLQAHHHVRGSTNETWNPLHLFIYSGRKLALENLCCNYKMTAQHPQPLGATRGMSNSIIHVSFPLPLPSNVYLLSDH